MLKRVALERELVVEGVGGGDEEGCGGVWYGVVVVVVMWRR